MARVLRGLVPHVVLCAVALVALAWWTGAQGQVSMDEGVAVLQARAVAHGTWVLPDPLASVDPTGTSFPLRFEASVDGGYVPFAKHPFYPQLLGLADRVGGVDGMIALSLLGALGAGVAASLLARRLDPALRLPALYGVALGSPLLFDSTLVMAHTLAAATAGAAAVGAATRLERGRGVASLGVVVVGTGVTVLLRGEGLLLAGAAVAVLGCWAVVRRDRSMAAVVGGLAGGAALGLVVDRVWAAQVRGGSAGLTVPGATGGWLQDRLDGLATVLLQPDYGSRGHAALLLLASALLGATALAAARPALRRAVAPLALMGAALAIAWAASGPVDPVPGLLLACPALWVGLVAARPWSGSPLATGLAAVSAAFAGLVALTQYARGGGFEWGARYLAVALPLIAPVALLGLVRAGRRLDASTARLAGVGFVAATVAISAGGLQVTRHTSMAADRIVAAVAPAAPSVVPGDPADRRPVIVSTEFALPQGTWKAFDGARWLLASGRPPAPTADGADPRLTRLLDSGIDRFSVLTRNVADARARLGATGRIVRIDHVGGLSLVLVEPKEPVG